VAPASGSHRISAIIDLQSDGQKRRNPCPARGATVAEINTTSPTKAILSNVLDLNANRIELSELPPQSLHKQAMDRWH
jgi:hypothetical protein